MADKTVRDYSSIHTIKEFAQKELAPKYFEVADINQLNVGLLGLTTDFIANATEDTLNALSMYIREIMPNTAQLPETLYNNAARLQIEELTATPSKMDVILFINENDIVTMGENKGNRVEFVLDSNLVVDIESKRFMPDYDVHITAKPHRGDYIFTASMDTSFQNSVSTLKNPYIRTRRIHYSGQKYLGIMITVRNVDKFEITENLIDNDKINLPTITFNFNDQLAGFDVLYRAPGEANFTQLQKRLFNASPIRDPFCFYRLRDDRTVEISFTMRESYFQPLFNSEILIRVYTTSGPDGNFPLYTGPEFHVLPKSETYDYNNNLVILGVAQTPSVGGKDKLSLEELRNKIVELTSTSGAYTTESDLQLFFDNNRGGANSDILFIKKRDDALERLFSAFSLYRDSDNDIFPTNTLNLDLDLETFDTIFDVSGRYLLKPGHLFRYSGPTAELVEVMEGTINDDLDAISEEFIYTNPYLITVTKSPGIVGYYLNSIKENIILDYNYINSDSQVQFICNNLNIYRNSISGDDEYTLRLTLMPTAEGDLAIVDENGDPTGNLVIRGTIEDFLPNELCMFNFVLVSHDLANEVYTFEAKIKTDDYMSTAEKFRIKDVMDISTGEIEDKMVPMHKCKINFNVFYKYSDLKIPHKYDHMAELLPFTLTNVYSTDDVRVNFISPVNMMRSQVKFIDLNPTDPEDPAFSLRLSSVPFIKAKAIKETAKYEQFLIALYTQYASLQNILSLITNNFGVDMKFYRSYGRSRNFLVGENQTRLDRVNTNISFRVSQSIGVEESELIRDLKIFIKDYIENINSKGYNAIYVSNLMREIENTFPSVQYMKFIKINEYDSSVQAIINKGVQIELMTKEERREYVPEYLTISLSDIDIEIIPN